MPQNYTFNASTSVTATSETGYSQSQSGSFQLNITGVDQVETGRKDITTSGVNLMAAVGAGKVLYVRNLDNTNFVDVTAEDNANHVIARLEPGEWMFTILRETDIIDCTANTATVTVEYFAVEIDANA